LLQEAVERGATLIETSGVAAVASSSGRRWCVRLDARGRSPDVIAAAVIVATGRAVATPLRFGAELRRVDRLIALTALSSAAHW
jgi:glycerol-3-phosphate dehydrogenase